ncbi:hypothetical protein [Paenibacillus sp. NPDC093718]|uniref:hypothetical protein n=1 Tax=Paenibacillus sp. NPDC093718 TaxID=3390601 RepID=UPI003D03A1C7
MQLTLDLFQDELFIVNSDLDNLLITEMTLTEFMMNSKWEAFLDTEATGEGKGNYYMKQPDGSKYRGGWIGKYRSAEQAKKEFHYRQLYWALHGNGYFLEKALASYPKLHQAYKEIQAYRKSVFVSEGDYVRVCLNGENRFFHIHDCPMFSRVSMRAFVKGHGLAELNGNMDQTFNPIEIACIAIEQVMEDRIGSRYRPSDVYPGFSELENLTGMKIRFRIPQHFNETNEPQDYKVLEGVSRFNGWSYGLRVHVEGELQDEDEVYIVFPSQILLNECSNLS